MILSSRIADVEHLVRPLRRFYGEDARRARSREVDVGLRWRSRDGSTYRAAWVEETGELYAVRHGEPDDGERATVLAEVSAETLEREAGGWRELCESDEPGTYEELRGRAAEVDERVRFSSRR
jgi:hypothetical protein